MNHRNRNGNGAVKEAPKKEEEVKPVIPEEKIEPEIIEPLTKKIYDDVALIGKTSECRDFRAICAKNSWTIKDKLTEMLGKWNTENYNL